MTRGRAHPDSTTLSYGGRDAVAIKSHSIVQVQGAQVERHEKEAHELSAQELADAIARLECLKVERARPVIDGEVIVDVFD